MDERTPQVNELPTVGDSTIKDIRRGRASQRRVEIKKQIAQREDYMTLAEACQLLGVSESQVRKIANRHGVSRDRNHGLFGRTQLIDIAQRRVSRGKANA